MPDNQEHLISHSFKFEWKKIVQAFITANRLSRQHFGEKFFQTFHTFLPIFGLSTGTALKNSVFIIFSWKINIDMTSLTLV